MRETKERVVEREKQQKEWEAEKAKKKAEYEERKKAREQRAEEQAKRKEELKLKREEEQKKREEERVRKEEERTARAEAEVKLREQKQREWEEAQMRKFEINPYVREMQLCDELIKYCQKNRLRDDDEEDEKNNDQEEDDEFQKKIDDSLKKMKIEQVVAKDERDNDGNKYYDIATGKAKKGKKKRDGPLAWSNEDPDALNLDISQITKFAEVRVSAPLHKTEVAATLEQLKKMREALQLKGDLQKEEAKSKFLANKKDASEEEQQQTNDAREKLVSLLKENGLGDEVQDIFEKKKTYTKYTNEEGINIDEFNEEEDLDMIPDNLKEKIGKNKGADETQTGEKKRSNKQKKANLGEMFTKEEEFPGMQAE